MAGYLTHIIGSLYNVAHKSSVITAQKNVSEGAVIEVLRRKLQSVALNERKRWSDFDLLQWADAVRNDPEATTVGGTIPSFAEIKERCSDLIGPDAGR